MDELPNQFPIQKVSGDVLAGVARRAREQVAQSSGGAASESPAVSRQASPFVRTLQKWMHGAGIGVLDLAAIAALLFLSVSLLWMYAGGRHSAKDAAARKVAQAGPREPNGTVVENVSPPAVLTPRTDPKTGARAAPAGDGGGIGTPAVPPPQPPQPPAPAQNTGRTPQTDEVVALALRWLAYHQEPDGHWDSMKYGAANKVDTAMTGLATLAFLGAGHTEKAGAYKENVKRAVSWLISKQHANGMVCDESDAGAPRGIGYPNAIATHALAEAAGMGRVPRTIAAAQSALDYCVNVHQQRDENGKGGWSYQPNMPGDLSVSGWYIGALVSGKVAQLRIDSSAFDGAIRFLDSVEVKEHGISHYVYTPKANAKTNARCCAIGNFCRQFLGWKKSDLEQSVTAFVNEYGCPTWGANGELVDFYYWYYGSLCTFQQGGKVWERWDAGLRKALTQNQCKHGDDAGSFPIVGEFSAEWGRVGQTALGALCAEVYYRYAQLHPDAKPQIIQAIAPAEPVKAAPPQVSPQLADKLKTKVTFQLIEKNLSQTVNLLNQLTDVNVKIAPGLRGQDRIINLRVTEMPLDSAISWVTRLTGLEWREENGAIVIDVPKPNAGGKKAGGEENKDRF